VIGVDNEREQRFDALFGEHVASIASYCRWRSSSAVDGEDAVAEVFLIAWRRLDDIPAGVAARAWLYAVARKVLANQARASARRERLSEKLSAQPAARKAEDAPLIEPVRQALAALAPRDREVLLLSEWEGLTPSEIAKVMRCPVVTARGRLFRARRRFRAAFDVRSTDAQGGRDAPLGAQLAAVSCDRISRPRTPGAGRLKEPNHAP
jgi:RNA polymerase sigma-70 factor (ECF subfamily)